LGTKNLSLRVVLYVPYLLAEMKEMKEMKKETLILSRIINVKDVSMTN